MTRFTELLSTNEVHSAYEDVTTTSVEDTAPASVEDPVNPKPLDFNSMTKLELETFGRTIGIELDRRHSKSKLTKTLQDHIEYMKTV